MDLKYGVLAVAGICVLVLLIGVLKRKAEISEFYSKDRSGIYWSIFFKRISGAAGD